MRCYSCPRPGAWFRSLKQEAPSWVGPLRRWLLAGLRVRHPCTWVWSLMQEATWQGHACAWVTTPSRWALLFMQKRDSPSVTWTRLGPSVVSAVLCPRVA